MKSLGTVFCIVLLMQVFSCHRGINSGKVLTLNNTDVLCEYAHRAIFENFDTLVYTDMQAGKWLVHPELRYRDTLFADFHGGFKYPMEIPTGSQVIKSQKCLLIIPDSIRPIFEYFMEGDGIPKDSSLPVVCYFSPLIRTSEADVFLQQMYKYFTTSEELGSERMVLRCYRKYMIRNGEIHFKGVLREGEELYNLF